MREPPPPTGGCGGPSSGSVNEQPYDGHCDFNGDDTRPRVCYQKTALNRTQLYSVRVSGTRNFQNTTDQSNRTYLIEGYQILERVSPPQSKCDFNKEQRFIKLIWCGLTGTTMFRKSNDYCDDFGRID